MSPSCEMYVESPYIVNEDGKLIKRTAILMLKARSSRRDVLALQADCEKRTRNDGSFFWFSPAKFSSGFESLAERIRRNPCISRRPFPLNFRHNVVGQGCTSGQLASGTRSSAGSPTRLAAFSQANVALPLCLTPPWGAAGFGRPRGAQLECDLRHQGRCAGAWHGTAKDKEFKARVAGGFMPCSVRE